MICDGMYDGRICEFMMDTYVCAIWLHQFNHVKA